jgi:hypothetical protein
VTGFNTSLSHACIHTHTQTHTHTHKHTYVYMYAYIMCVCVCVCVCIKLCNTCEEGKRVEVSGGNIDNIFLQEPRYHRRAYLNGRSIEA